MTIFGFIGTGHLGSILVRKFVKTGAIKAENIIVSNRTSEKAELIARELNSRFGSNLEVAAQSDVIFLCVRPLDVKGVLKETYQLLTPEKLLVSLAVDFALKDLRALCRSKVTRVVPSIACDDLKGVSLMAMGDNVTRQDEDLLVSLFGAIGEPFLVEEAHFEVMADLTSCGPGYISALLHEFALAASWRGIPKDLAEELVKKTLVGTTSLLKEESFEDLILSVATKGGITEEGVKVIHDKAPEMFSELFMATRAKHEAIKRLIEDQD
jgi:pyrroline-5-carboxylate reductase